MPQEKTSEPENLIDLLEEETAQEQEEQPVLEQESSEEQEAAEQQPVEKADDSGCEEPECQNQLIRFIKEQFGEDLSHYKNDLEAIKGLINARKAVGKRDQDAKILSAIRARYGDQFVEQLLTGQLPQQVVQQDQQQTDDEEQVEWDDRWLAMVQRDEEGNLVPAKGAPPDVVDKVLRFVRHRETIINEFAKNPKKFIAATIEQSILPKIEQLLDAKLNYKVSRAAEDAALSDWAYANRNLLFENGDPNGPMTPLGEEITALADTLMADGISSPHKALQRAWEIVRSKQSTPPKQPKVPSPASLHAPQKSSKAKALTLEDLIDQGYSLSEAYKKLRSAGGAGK